MVQKKTTEAVRNADLILFIVEAGNALPIEKEYINYIRKMGKKTIVVMNKSDSPEKDILANEYYSYCLGEPIPISAAHNRNIDLLMEKILSIFQMNDMPQHWNEDKEPDIKIAIIGKPNVGKSSLLNKIVEKDRSIVTAIPGTTRDIVDEKFKFDDKSFLFLDTAGIRKKARVNENIEYYSVNRALKCIGIADIIFFVMDSLEDISEQDKKIADQIVKNGKGLIIILNKWDLQKKNKISFEEKKEKLFFKFPVLNYVPILPISALTGEGINKLLKMSLKVYDELYKKITTSQLNNFIKKIVKKFSPSSKKGVLKIYYGTQTNVAPVKFVFFINKKSLLSNNYSQYIINRIREDFGYSGIPIKVSFRDKRV